MSEHPVFNATDTVEVFSEAAYTITIGSKTLRLRADGGAWNGIVKLVVVDTKCEPPDTMQARKLLGVRGSYLLVSNQTTSPAGCTSFSNVFARLFGDISGEVEQPSVRVTVVGGSDILMAVLGFGTDVEKVAP